jgi:choline dehydrogenase-like flavoprotein
VPPPQVHLGYLTCHGGSSSINAMIYTQGNPYDYDHSQAQGNQGWGFADVLTGPLSHAFIAACVECGLRRNDDFNGPVQEGVGLFQVTQKGGKRHSAATAYLRPARCRRNLTVRTRANVGRVLFDRRRAVGGLIMEGSRPQCLRAAREVLLCDQQSFRRSASPPRLYGLRRIELLSHHPSKL